MLRASSIFSREWTCPPSDKGNDLDFGSGGILLIPKRDGSSPRLAVTAGKKGEMFLLIATTASSMQPPTMFSPAVDWPLLVRTVFPLPAERRSPGGPGTGLDSIGRWLARTLTDLRVGRLGAGDE